MPENNLTPYRVPRSFDSWSLAIDKDPHITATKSGVTQCFGTGRMALIFCHGPKIIVSCLCKCQWLKLL